MSTSQSRREQRALKRFRAMPADKLIKKIKKVLPNLKLTENKIHGEMTYDEWLSQIEITPQMYDELLQHDADEKKMGALQIGAKNLNGFPFEVVKPKPINVKTSNKQTGFEYEEVK